MFACECLNAGAAVTLAVRESSRPKAEALQQELAAKTGERVRFPDEVLSTKMATELDMALLFASLLEAIGLHVLIAFSEGSVMVGSWLIPDTFVDVTSDDVSLLSKRLAKGIEELAFINTKRLFANSYTSLKLS